MASANEQVVNVPLIAGVDAYTDPNNLAPPALLRADNVCMVNKGALQTRNGFSLVESTAGSPATAFDGDARPGAAVEAVCRYSNAEGDRTLLAADSKLYEFVGSDATHGWRTVNRLPEHTGMLHAVTSSGGSVLEVDAIPDSTNAVMVTSWVTGPRTGQEFSSDLAYADLSTGLATAQYGNIVYYAVQRIVDGSYVVPPTVLRANTGTVICNLRMTKVAISASDYQILIAWQENSTLFYRVYNPITATLSVPYSLGAVGQTCFRSFDITGVSWSQIAQPSVLWAACSADLGAAGPAPLYCESTFIDPVTGAPSLNASLADAMAKAPPGAGSWYRAWAQRGVVLEQEPSGTVALSARVITQYYSPVPAVATGKLDGQLWTVILTPTFGGLSVSANNAQIPFIGFQSRDNHDNVLATATGTTNVSGTVQVTRPLQTTASLPLFTASALKTPLTITGTFPDATVQTYVAASAIWTQYVPPPALGVVPYMMLVGLQRNIAGFSQNIAQSLGTAGGFPEPTHQYPRDAPVQIDTSAANQITQIDLTTMGGPMNGYVPGVHAGCAVQVGAATICYVTVYVNPVGVVTEVAIENGLPGAAPPGLNPNTPLAITNIVIPPAGPVVWPAGGLAYVHTYARAVDFVALDAPGRSQRTTNAKYVQDGQLEQCVHRWDVTQLDGRAYIALSSVSANLMTTPNGDEPYGAAEPHKQNNFFEIYRWDEASDRLLVNTTGSTTPDVIAAALGGPWRLVAGLRRDTSASALFCSICPGGDEYQRNTFMLRVDTLTAIAVRYPATGKTDPSAADYVYEGNPGVFVESANMMRVTSPPLNVPTLRGSLRGFAAGALRDGASRGTQEVFYIEYERSPKDWRNMLQFSDYVFINGGVLSCFDSISVNEAIPLMWPQKDLTSINWPMVSPDLFIVTDQGSQQNALATFVDRKSTRLNSSHIPLSRMPSSA